MSSYSPGIPFDACRSWNGYNHQGKLAVWYAVEKINCIIEKSKGSPDITDKLEQEFLEIENVEDFSYGHFDSSGEPVYDSVHQVKNKKEKGLGDYDDAFEGLSVDLMNYPSVKEAYLHVTLNLGISEEQLVSHVENMIKSDNLHKAWIEDLNQHMKKPDFRLRVIKGCKADNCYKNLLRFHDSDSKWKSIEVADDNLDEFLSGYEEYVVKLESDYKASANKIASKIRLFKYVIDGNKQSWCGEDQILPLLKSALRKFYKLSSGGIETQDEEYIGRALCFIMYEFDRFIIQRSMSRGTGTMLPRLKLSWFFQKLQSNEINKQGEGYYLNEIVFFINEYIYKYCRDCHDYDHCPACCVPDFRETFARLDREHLKNYLHLSTPDENAGFDKSGYAVYFKKNEYRNSILSGMSSFANEYLDRNTRYSFTDTRKLRYMLTTLASSEPRRGMEGRICSNILKNDYVYDLLMDYERLISTDLNIDDIGQYDTNISHYNDDEKNTAHIMHFKQVSIVSVGNAKNKLGGNGDGSDK